MTAAQTILLAVTTGERPLTVNAERRRHWRRRHEHVDAWRQAAAYSLVDAARHLRLTRAEFEFTAHYHAGPVPDTGALHLIEKAIVDAAVDVGIIPDDNRFHNAGQTSRPPRISDFYPSNWVIEVAVTETEPAPGHGPGECDCRRRWERNQLAQQLGKSRR